MKTSVTCLLVSLSVAGYSLAAEQPEGKPRPGALMEQMDKNGDGSIGKDEAPAPLWENRLSKLDKNNDGAISKEELLAGAPGPSGRPGGPGPMFQFFDKDGDGKVTQAEAGERWEKLSKMDKDGDGVISKEEIPAMGPEGRHFNPAEMIGRMDTDGDGKVTQAEAGERWERVGKLDKNGDGAITKDEVPAFGAGRGPGSEGPGGRHFNPAEMIGRMDTDGDGKVTQAEAGERWEKLSKMDKNGDGAISKDEIPTFGAGPGAGRPNPGEFFSRMDKDGNGELTSSEVPAELWERMSKADANGNGSISKEEMEAMRPGAGGRGPKEKPQGSSTES